jgi:hypothetical protein
MRRSITRALLVVTLLAIGFIAGQISAAQPHMNAAIKQLRAAKSSLNKATPDKGGHRERAIDLVDRAINEVERGIAYDRRR